MSAHGLLDDLILIPIPVFMSVAVLQIRFVATSGTSLDPRPRWRKWLAYAAIIWGAGLACGLYTDAMRLFRYGWPHDWLTGLSGTIAFLLIATAAALAGLILWGLCRLLKAIFPDLSLWDGDWDITAGL